MSILPFNRVVNVTLDRNDAYPARRGFGTPLMISTEEVAGEVDASNRTKLYASIEEVASDWVPGDDVYEAAETFFARSPRPIQMKVGYVSLASSFTGNDLTAQLDLIYAADQDWYMLTIDKALRDNAALDELMEWIEAKNKFALIDSNDAGHETSGNTTSVSARNKGQFERTAVFYHTDADEWLAISAAGYMATRNFDEANSAYTLKFKELHTVAPVNLASAKISAITGFTPGVGQSATVGHLANTYIDIGGRNFVVEGSTLKANVFVDEIHATDWIIARTEEELLAVLLNNDRVKFDDSGMQVLASAARTVMQQAHRAGLIADDLNPETGDYEAAITYTVPSVFDVPASQRVNRIAPAIEVQFRYAGAVHYSTINYTMNF